MELYIREHCPYCIKVRKAIEGIKLDITLKDIADEENETKLIELGGKRQVPFLVDGDTMMYESDDIIDYLQAKK